MSGPDATRHAPAPEDFQRLADQTGLSLAEIARRLGISYRTILRYKARGAPYPVQYCVEQLARE